MQELRGRGREVGKRAALDRERAGGDRRKAAHDRELGARDREQSKQDRDHAATDELTGAYRRGVGLEEVEREIARARRTGHSLVAAYVDVDGLKAVNDTHGHSAGDELLRDVAESLRHRMRTYDLLVRLGGDEFLCVLPGVSVDEVRRRFHDLESELPAGSTLGSVSIGLSELRDGENAQELINRADRNLLAGRSE
ncbi:MAG TPA: GGDEF domain-containing protein [Thermoleophilaceae bacterium]|nr:GGDEF domain-containing protein [Thermoleophilaceae bacterium]